MMANNIKAIKENKNFIFTGISLMIVIFWFLNFQFWHILIFYLLLSTFYFLFNSIWLGRILAKLLNLEKELQIFFGFFVLLFLIAFGMAVPIFFYKVTPTWLFGLLVFLTIAISFFNHQKYFQDEPVNSFKDIEDGGGINIPRIFYFLLSTFYFLALWFLLKSRTGNFILSPWEAIRSYYLYLWFGIAFITGLFVFSKEKIWKILLVIILASLLMHAYLLVVYKMGFGGDKWRHLGSEKWLMEGKIYSPALFGEPVSWKQIGPLKFPELFIVGNKNSYANLWGMTIALSWLLKIDVFWIDLLLGYLLYSIFFPLLLFKLGQFFVRKKSFLLLLSFLPACFSPFQMYGSVTVPNPFGFLLFVLALICLFQYFHNKWLVVLLFLPILYLNYILYLILFVEFVAVAWLIGRIKKSGGRRVKYLYVFGLFLAVICFLIFIPLMDTVNDYSQFKNLSAIKTDIGNNLLDFGIRLGASKPIFPRIGNMEQDNWSFVQINQYLSRAIILKLAPWFLIFTPLIWLLLIWGALSYRKINGKSISLMFLIFLFIILSNQFISAYFMDGNHIFSKRLVMINAFLMAIFVALGLWQWINWKHFALKARIISAVLFLSLLSTTVYASGPKMQTVIEDELLATKYLWQKIKSSSISSTSLGAGQKYCVLANTWPLLALEAESGREIITGGFPFYYEYRQPERVQLFDNMNKNPSIKDIESALAVTGAKDCYFMTEERWIYPYQKSQILGRLNKIFGQSERIGSVYLWRYNFQQKR